MKHIGFKHQRESKQNSDNGIYKPSFKDKQRKNEDYKRNLLQKQLIGNFSS